MALRSVAHTPPGPTSRRWHVLPRNLSWRTGRTASLAHHAMWRAVGEECVMLEVEVVPPAEVERAAVIFHRDGFVVVREALTPAQLAFAQAGARRVIAEQMAATPLEQANRGFARYSFGPQLQHPEWRQLV